MKVEYYLNVIYPIPSSDFDDDCGDGSDERNCIKSECGADQFRCDNGQCISKKWQCDMEKDCQDGSDERGCLTQAPRCKPEEFHCPGGGQCLPTSWKCDGDRDCPDGSDEEDCAHVQCKDYQFACGSGGGCVFDTWRCDGTSDCPDGSDEANCTEIGSSSERPDHRGTGPRPVFPKGKCNQWMFKCSNEECIPYWWKCDGTPDCSDASDELECHNGNNSNSGAPPLPPPPPAPPSSPASCSDSKFRCNSGQCVWQAWVCDDDEDCEDGSDESEEVCADVVRCSQHEYRCELSGECMDSAKLCDGKRDCADGSDETGCDGDDPEYDDDDDTYYEDDDGTPHLRCQEGEFSCDNGGYCIPASKQCNGVVDCYDGTDELHCQLPSRIGGIQVLDSRNFVVTLYGPLFMHLKKKSRSTQTPSPPAPSGSTGGSRTLPAGAMPARAPGESSSAPATRCQGPTCGPALPTHSQQRSSTTSLRTCSPTPSTTSPSAWWGETTKTTRAASSPRPAPPPRRPPRLASPPPARRRTAAPSSPGRAPPRPTER